MNIQNILSELYVLDPSLREHEAELKKIIDKIIMNKPKVLIDEAFVQNLRRSILQTEQKKSLIFSLSFMKNKTLVASGAVLVALLAIGIPWYLNQAGNMSNSLALRENMNSGIVSLKQGAFGSLLASGSSAPLGSPEAMSSVRHSSGGGGSAVSNMAVSNPPMADAKMIAPAYNYSFVYAGPPFTVDQSTLPVYNRVKSSAGSEQLARLLAGQNNGLVDLNLFRNTRVQNITLVEDRADGYSITLEMQEGRASIGPAYDQWYKPNCTPDGNCQYPEPLRESDVPSNERLIQIANDFLSSYSIDRSSYGEPQVDDMWKGSVMPLSARAEAAVYVPDVISVIYPLKVEGQEISESNGMGYGLRVQVDIRKMKSQGVWNIVAQNYQKSDYVVETNVDRILKFAQSGWGGWYGAGEKVELQLGAPERVYVAHYQYSYDTQSSNELFIPALRFPILNAPKDQPYFQKFVVVPLPKEILDNQEKQMGGVMPIDGRPVQILRSEPAVGEASVAQNVSDEVKKVFEQYVKENIASVSPHKAVLGGKFMVTNVEHQAGANALVSYEDGHNAYTLQVRYEVNEPGKVEIKFVEELKK